MLETIFKNVLRSEPSSCSQLEPPLEYIFEEPYILGIVDCMLCNNVYVPTNHQICSVCHDLILADLDSDFP